MKCAAISAYPTAFAITNEEPIMAKNCPVCGAAISETGDTCHTCQTPIRWHYGTPSVMKSVSLFQPEMLYIVYAILAVWLLVAVANSGL